MLIQTENTPNPNTLKFLPGKKVSEAGPIEVHKKDLKIDIPLAKNILSIKGTSMVFFAEDFITVKKDENFEWKDLKHGIISQINEFYSKGNTVVVKSTPKENLLYNQDNQHEDEIINKIKNILDDKIRPAVARDGGDIKFKSFENGVVKVELRGSCSGCPSSIITLKQGVQNLLSHYIPEVKSVEAN